MKLSKLVLVAAFVFVPALVMAQDSGSTTPPADTSTPPAVSSAPAPSTTTVTAPAPAPAPLSNLDLNSALNMVDADIAWLFNDLKTNTKFQVNGVMATQGFDVKNGQWLTGIGLPFLNVGSMAYVAAELDRQTTCGGGGVGCKPIPLIAGEVRLNSVTTPIVKWGLSRIPVLNNNPEFIGNMANALSLGVAVGHDLNSDINQKVVFNRIVADMNFTYKFGGPSTSN